MSAQLRQRLQKPRDQEAAQSGSTPGGFPELISSSAERVDLVRYVTCPLQFEDSTTPVAFCKASGLSIHTPHVSSGHLWSSLASRFKVKSLHLSSQSLVALHLCGTVSVTGGGTDIQHLLLPDLSSTGPFATTLYRASSPLWFLPIFPSVFYKFLPFRRFASIFPPSPSVFLLCVCFPSFRFPVLLTNITCLPARTGPFAAWESSEAVRRAVLPVDPSLDCCGPEQIFLKGSRKAVFPRAGN